MVRDAGFDRNVLDTLDRTDEVRIQTRQDGSSPGHGTIIWVVVVDGAVFVRSVRGGRGRWYREASANPEAALLVEDRRIPIRVVHEKDGGTIEKVSGAYRKKYEASYPGPTAGIVREEVRPTTLRLLPA